MKTFYLDRDEDPTGISGTGRVAEGVIFTDGRISMRWLTQTTSTGCYECIEDVEKLHCHGGSTKIAYPSDDAVNLNELKMAFEVMACAPPDMPRKYLYKSILKLGDNEIEVMKSMRAEEVAEASALAEVAAEGIKAEEVSGD